MTTSQWDQIVQIIVLLMTTVVLPIVGYYASRFLSQHASLIQNNRTAQAAMQLVKSAEQIGGTDEQKRTRVGITLRSWFPFLTGPEVDSLINAAVLTVHTDLGISSHVPWGEPFPPTQAPGTATPPPQIDLTQLAAELSRDLTQLVAPSLAPDITRIVESHLAPATSTPADEDGPQPIPDVPPPSKSNTIP